MKKVFLLLGFSTLLLSCEKEMDKETVFKGAEVSVHHGKAWSWIRLNNEGAPQQLAVSINDATLHSLPTGTSGGDHTHENNVIIPLHPPLRLQRLLNLLGPTGTLLAMMVLVVFMKNLILIFIFIW
jgi:hypothetical protein